MRFPNRFAMKLFAALFNSSIGRKFLMALTGLILLGFVVGHLVGNLQIFSGPEKLNGYAQFLRQTGPTLWIVRGGLILSTLVHIWAATVLTIDNHKSRGTYGFTPTIQATLSSRTMRFTGIVVLAFVFYHLAHFTFGGVQAQHFKENLPAYVLQNDYHVLGFVAVRSGTPVADVYSMAVYGFQNVLISVFYIIAIGLLSFHLQHGIQSSFQTLGLRNAKWSRGLYLLTVLFCLLYFVGNLAIPTAVLAGKVRLQPEVEKSVANLAAH